MKTHATHTLHDAERCSFRRALRLTQTTSRRCLSLSLLLLAVCLISATSISHAGDIRVQLNEVRSIDGSGNSSGGVANTPLIRKIPADYPDDGSGQTMVEWPDRENPRTISNVVSDQPSSVVNNRRRNDYLWAWGQFVDHDIDLTGASAANGTADILIVDPGDPLAPGPLFFDRSNYQSGTGTPSVPREQMNGITAFIDASNVYGSDATRAAALRTFVGGKLKTSAGDLLPFNLSGLPNAGGPDPSLFLAGDVRANEHILLSSLHTLFVREHNRLATLIALRDSVATDEEIYQLARKLVGAEMQIVTYQEFLPALLGPEAPDLAAGYYDSSVDPSITNEFSTAAYRFGHSLLSSRLKLDGGGLPVERIPLRDAFFRPDTLVADPLKVDRLLIGAGLQLCQEVDTRVVDDVRSFLFGSPGAGGLDLAALNIQRGRDHGIPTYNAVRAAYGLPTVTDFSDITTKTGIQARLAQVYASVDEIDAWVGGLAEDHLPGASTGPLLAASISDQFMRILEGDRLSFLEDVDLDQDLVRTIIDLPRLSLDEILRANTTSSLMTEDIFSVDGAVFTDVVTSYDPVDNRLHIIGSAGRNIVLLIETPFGMVIHGLGNTKINGSGLTIIPVGLNPHITIDLGGRDDRVYFIGCDLGDVTISFGGGTDILLTYFSSADSLYVDGGDGLDYFNTFISVPSGETRVLNIP